MAEVHEPDQRHRKQGGASPSPQALLRVCRNVRLQRHRQGTSPLTQLTYDYYEFVLKTEIANRQRLKKDFLETEVWYLLYNIVRAGSKFEHLKKKIGNVHPMNILINESGQIKIISTVSIPGELDNYELLLEKQHEIVNNIYLAPEEINNDLIQKGNYPSHVDPSLAEVFCIGLTILSSGTLEDCDNVYKYGPWELRKDRLNGLLRTFKEKYSDYLYETVASMLAFNPQERRRCSSIASALY
jgi:serine/threonine protein kinase